MPSFGIGWKAARSLQVAFVTEVLNVAQWTSPRNTIHGLICQAESTTSELHCRAAPSATVSIVPWTESAMVTVQDRVATQRSSSRGERWSQEGGLDDLEPATCRWVS
jgi:hypothetical protein